MARFESTDAYLASLDETKAKTLRQIIAFVLKEFPALQIKIAWNLPQIHQNGKYVFGLAAYKKHLTLAPWSQNVMDGFKDRLGGYVVFKNCFQIPVDWALDKGLLKDLVQARLHELSPPNT